MRGRRRPSPGAALLAGAALVLSGCGRDPAVSEADVIDRETFVATYVDLRTATLATPGDSLPAERKEEILGGHGVTEADLLAFAEAHGGDIDYMASLWAEVEKRLEERQAPSGEPTGAPGVPADTAGEPPPPPPSDRSNRLPSRA